MSQERWTQVEQVFQAAIDLSETERPAFLDQMCDGDPELREEVESLLAQDHNSGERIASVVFDAVEILHESENKASIGHSIGPYRITGIIGKGGMGVVYSAIRDDDEYQKEVALKVVRPSMDFHYSVARFRKERQILASLDHPNIARLLDGGTTEDGFPYFVMEYVDGANIVQHCESHYLQLQDRLKLFQQVCSAIQYAHQKLVIHRDIKPSNILVASDGTPKLLDFGIAKLLTPDSGSPMPTHTMTILRIMTPDYASPEQVRGLPISTTTDVYSLGVVLYELLSGQRPHLIQSYTPTEIERAICLSTTEKPSLAARLSGGIPSKLARQLTGDIDNIVLMAMRKEPERRYQSAAQLSEDINRFLQERPVIARADTLVYRTSKFVRRHKLGIVAVLLVIFSLLGGIIFANYQAQRAERRFQEVRKLANTFLFQFHDKIKDLPGSTEAREMVVQTSLNYLDSLAQEAADDPSLQRELADAYLKVGDVQGDPRGHNLGHPEAAMKSYRKAMALLLELKAGDRADHQILRSLATAYYKVGDLQVEMGDIRGGLETLRNATSAADQNFSKHPDNQQDLLLLIRSLRVLGDAEIKARNPETALQIQQRAVNLAEQMAVKFPGDSSQYHMSLSFTRVAEAQAEIGDINAAIDSLIKVLQIRHGLVQRNPSDATYRREWRHTHTWLGNFAGGLDTFNLGDKKTALKYYEKALDIAEELATADPKNAIFQNDLSICYSKVGDCFLDTDPSHSTELYRKALEINDRLLESSPTEFRFLSRQALFLRNIGGSLLRLGDTKGALQNLEKSLDTLQTMLQMSPTNAEVHAGNHATRIALADTLLEMNDFPSALRQYQEAVKIAENANAAGLSDLYARWRLADSYNGLGNYYATIASKKQESSISPIENWQLARSWYQKSHKIWNDWPLYARSTNFDISRKQQAAQSAARCESELARNKPD